MKMMLRTRPLIREAAGSSRAGMMQAVRDFGKMVRIKLGDIGEGTKEAKIKKWHV